MLRVIVETELFWAEPDVDHGWVTWFEGADRGRQGEENVAIGQARIARKEDSFRDRFTMRAGSDLLFVSHVDLKPGWEGRKIELALVHRLSTRLGEAASWR